MARPPKLDPEALARKAEHGAGLDDVKAALDQLTPEQAELFVASLELVLRKRRTMLVGYLAALAAIVLGQIYALYLFGNHEQGSFIGWVFLVPVAVAGVILWWFGRRARALRPSMLVERAAKAAAAKAAAAKAASGPARPRSSRPSGVGDG